jgi:hypothetical protein
VKILTIGLGVTRKAKVAKDMKIIPITRAVQPAAAALSGLLAPMAWPTLTAPAAETPRGTIKVKAAALNAI